MANTEIYFILKAEDYEQADWTLYNYLEGKGFYPSVACMLEELSGPLTEKRDEISDLLNRWAWEKKAKYYLRKAEKNHAKGNFKKYGELLILAGELYSQKLTTNAWIFNMDSEDYSVPDEDENRWVVVAGLH